MFYRFPWILLFLGLTAGCQDRMAAKLQGRWIGQPDTRANQAEREALRYQDLIVSTQKKSPMQDVDRSNEIQMSAPSQHDSQSDNASLGTNPPISVTDWEHYDVQILLEFAGSQQVNMSLADGSEPRSGAWRVIRETPIGLVIEIETRQSGLAANREGPGKIDVSTERRRFELQLDFEDPSTGGQSCVGFRLIELGADPRLGAIYFQREKAN